MHILEKVEIKVDLIEYEIIFPKEELPKFIETIKLFYPYTNRLQLIPNVNLFEIYSDNKILVEAHFTVEELTILKLTLSHNVVYRKKYDVKSLAFTRIE